MQKCQSCKLSKDSSCFNKRKTSPNGLQPTCRECNKKSSRQYYADNKRRHLKVVTARKRKNKLFTQTKIFEHLSSHPCVDCGENNVLTLDFDHLRDKKQGISEMICGNYSWESIEKEIEKCEVRCRKCHSIKTHRMFQTWRWKLYVKQGYE